MINTTSREDLLKLINHFRQEVMSWRSRFLVHKGSRFISIAVEDIAMIYTRDRGHYIKTFAGDDYQIDTNLDRLEEELNPSDFYRVNRQFILNYRSIDQVLAWFDGKLKVTVKPAGYEDIIISRLKATDFKVWLGK